MIQLRNVPDSLHRTLKARAALVTKAGYGKGVAELIDKLLADGHDATAKKRTASRVRS